MNRILRIEINSIGWSEFPDFKDQRSNDQFDIRRARRRNVQDNLQQGWILDVHNAMRDIDPKNRKRAWEYFGGTDKRKDQRFANSEDTMFFTFVVEDNV